MKMQVSCAKLTTAEIRHLTSVLRCDGPDTGACADADAKLQPNSSNHHQHHRLASIIPSFSSPLSPSRSSSRRSSDSPGPRLCARLHAPLNLDVYTIHSLFTRLMAEVGPNLDSLVDVLLHPGRRRCGLSLSLSTRQKGLVARLRALGKALALGYGRGLCWDGYGYGYGYGYEDREREREIGCRGRRWGASGEEEAEAPRRRGKGGSQVQEYGSGYGYEYGYGYTCECEASTLSALSVDASTLLDLRMLLLSRTRTKPKPHTHTPQAGSLHHHSPRQPTLLLFVDAWLEQSGVGQETLMENWQEAQGLKGVRKGFWRARRCRQRNGEGFGRERDRRRRSGAPEPEDVKAERDSRLAWGTGVDVGGVLDLDVDGANFVDLTGGANGASRGGGSVSDFEMEIIDAYADAATTTTSAELHVAWSGSRSETETETETDHVSSSSSRLRGSGASTISETTTVAPSMHRNWTSKRTAQDRARSYQDLLGMPSPQT